LLKQYFDEHNQRGYEYAFTYPGMNKVLQAAGRVIRTEEDRGVIALLDDRFLNLTYKSLFPREWDNYKVVNIESVQEEILDFW
jgi:Rad3-related DNA helicase